MIVVFFIDTRAIIVYHDGMFNGIRLFTTDPTWRQILGDLNATVTDAPGVGVLDFDKLGIKLPINITDLRATVLGAMDFSHLVTDIVGKNITLSPIQERIVALLYQSGGMSVADIKIALGYSPDVTTHVVETAIYALRKICGHDFIQNTDGVYKLGRV